MRAGALGIAGAALAAVLTGFWVSYRPASSDTTTWIIIDAEGSPRGRLDLPIRVRILWHRGNEFLASVPDDLDVPWLVRYTLSEAGQD